MCHLLGGRCPPSTSLAHDGITAWEPPRGGWVVIPSTTVHVGWLYSTCVNTMIHIIIYYTMGHRPLKSNFRFI